MPSPPKTRREENKKRKNAAVAVQAGDGGLVDTEVADAESEPPLTEKELAEQRLRRQLLKKQRKENAASFLAENKTDVFPMPLTLEAMKESIPAASNDTPVDALNTEEVQLPGVLYVGKTFPGKQRLRDVDRAFLLGGFMFLWVIL